MFSVFPVQSSTGHAASPVRIWGPKGAGFDDRKFGIYRGDPATLWGTASQDTNYWSGDVEVSKSGQGTSGRYRLSMGYQERLLLPSDQRIQNTAARIICRKRKHDHISPILKDLRWLTVKCRIDFKILLMCFKSLCGLAPAYLHSLLREGTYVCHTRSSCSSTLSHADQRQSTAIAASQALLPLSGISCQGGKNCQSVQDPTEVMAF
jgi:hypothetical protein